MKLTAIGGGYYIVYVGGEEYSKHTTEREAIENVWEANKAHPTLEINYVHDYDVILETDEIVKEPAPSPEPTPPSDSDMIFSPTSVYNIKLHNDFPIHPMSDQFVSNLVSQTKPSTTENAGQVEGKPYINMTSYSSGIWHVTEDIPMKVVKLIYTDGNTKSGALYDRLQQGFRIPDEAVGADGYDKHMIVYDWVSDAYLELYRYDRDALTAVYGGVIDNASQSDGSMGKYGAMATGIPMISTMITKADLEDGVINHPVGITVPYGSEDWVWPATRTDDPHKPMDPRPESIRAGQRFRLPADYIVDTSLSLGARLLRQAARDYGLIVVDSAKNIAFRAEDAEGMGDLLGEQRWSIAEKFPYNQLQALDWS